MTVVKGRWFPASVVLPGVGTLRRVYVLLAQGGDHDGLHIWLQPDLVAAHRLPVNWAATVVPRGRIRTLGVTLTDGRIAVVTIGGGCRCGALGKWSGPEWARTVAV